MDRTKDVPEGWIVDDIRDLLSEAISESIDMDWQPSWGADAIMRRLAKEGLGFIDTKDLTRAASNLERYPFESATMAEGALMAATALRKAVTDPASIFELTKDQQP